ncbi:MAG: hypothetical protein J7K47_01320 [Thermoplasmata archaeon]|nr:hypothetical protein [Thermoplasmata archaeon]
MKLAMAAFSASMLLLLTAYSYIEHDEKDPDMAYIMKNFEKFEGKKVDFAGRFASFNGSAARLKLMEPPYCIVNVTGKILNTSLHKGDVEVLGRMQEPHKIEAEKIHVIKRFEYSLIFFRSLPAIPFVA